jgi:RNA polymerase sigma-70 factor, ECF subfamily
MTPVAALMAPDADLMQRVCAGDADAFGEVVARYGDRVVGYLARLTGSRARAEDLAQETFLRLYEKRHLYRERGQLAAFLYRMATRLLVSEQRRLARRDLFGRLFLTPTAKQHDEPTQQDEVLADEAQRQVASALTALPLDWRVPLVLHLVEGLSYPEIAGVLGCREGTVKSRLSRGRAALRQRLSPYFDGAPS